MPSELAACDSRGMGSTAIPLRTRIFAAALELLPFAGAALLFGANSLTSGIGLMLILASGLGWALIGKWDIGSMVAILRVMVLVLALIPVIAIAFQNIDCHPQCAASDDALAGLLIGVPFALTTAASALFVARARTRE